MVKNPPVNAADLRDKGSIPNQQGGEDPLDKEMATHSSTVAWRIPWTEEPGGLQVSMQACHTETKVLAEQIKCRVNFLLLSKPPLNSYQFLPLLQKWYYYLNTPSLNYIFFHSILFLNSKRQEYFIYHQEVPHQLSAPLSCQGVVEERINKPAAETKCRRGAALGFCHQCEPRVRPGSHDQSGK